MFYALLDILFGSPKVVLYARVLAAMASLCPCRPAGDACEMQHRRASWAIAEVASEEDDADDAAALLLGACAHETRCAVEHQAHGGPAVTVWQLEVPVAERPFLLAHHTEAARVALRAARACRGSMMAYAWGKCEGPPAVQQVAAELRGSVQAARWELARH